MRTASGATSARRTRGTREGRAALCSVSARCPVDAQPALAMGGSPGSACLFKGHWMESHAAAREAQPSCRHWDGPSR